jgi:hypothetical protein
MPWIRLDDKFPSHPKVAQLTDREFRVHVRVLCYCGEYRTAGRLPPSVWSEVPGLTKPIGARLLELGLWETADDGTMKVHDWAKYNPPDPTAAERMRRLRARNNTVTDTVTESEQERNGYEPSRARQHARSRPVLKNPPTPQSSNAARENPYNQNPRPAQAAHWLAHAKAQDVPRADMVDELQRTYRLSLTDAETLIGDDLPPPEETE